MGKDKDFSVFIKSRHVLYCFFLFESIREKKREDKTHGKTSQSTVILLTPGSWPEVPNEI